MKLFKLRVVTRNFDGNIFTFANDYADAQNKVLDKYGNLGYNDRITPERISSIEYICNKGNIIE